MADAMLRRNPKRPLRVGPDGAFFARKPMHRIIATVGTIAFARVDTRGARRAAAAGGHRPGPQRRGACLCEEGRQGLEARQAGEVAPRAAALGAGAWPAAQARLVG